MATKVKNPGKKPKPEVVSSSEEEVKAKEEVKNKKLRRAKKSVEKVEETKHKPVPPAKNLKETKKEIPPKQSDSEPDDDDEEYAAPKKPTTAYLYFSNANRAKFVEENPDSNGKQMMKIIGSAWSNSDTQERAPYEELAAKDKERYARQLDEYRTNGKFYDEDGRVVKLEKKRKRSMSKKKAPEKKRPTKKA
jgi:upstream-binding transcription factor